MREKTVTGRKIAFWGTGNICRQILRYRPDIQPELFIDNYAGENESPLEEVPVYHPRQVSSWEGIFVVLVIDRFLSVKEQLTKNRILSGIGIGYLFQISQRFSRKRMLS